MAQRPMISLVLFGFFFGASFCRECTAGLRIHWREEKIVRYTSNAWAESENYAGDCKLGLSGSFIALDTCTCNIKQKAWTYWTSSGGAGEL
jgi:hypothetical protein